MGKYFIKSNKTEFVNPETGEINKYTKSMELVKEEAEPFFLTYSRQIISLYNLPFFNTTTKVFWKLLEYAEFNTGKVYMNANRRKEVMEICELSKASYYRAVEELVKADIIEKIGDTYIINEEMFWKGDRQSREKLMQAKMKLSMEAVYDEDVQESEDLFK